MVARAGITVTLSEDEVRSIALRVVVVVAATQTLGMLMEDEAEDIANRSVEKANEVIWAMLNAKAVDDGNA